MIFEERGCFETARRLRATIGAVFRYAVATSRAEIDPTPVLRGAIVPPKSTPRAAITNPKKLGGLELEILEMKDGDVLVGSYWVFDRNGKGFVRRGIGKAADGKSHEFEEFYVK